MNRPRWGDAWRNRLSGWKDHPRRRIPFQPTRRSSAPTWSASTWSASACRLVEVSSSQVVTCLYPVGLIIFTEPARAGTVTGLRLTESVRLSISNRYEFGLIDAAEECVDSQTVRPVNYLVQRGAHEHLAPMPLRRLARRVVSNKPPKTLTAANVTADEYERPPAGTSGSESAYPHPRQLLIAAHEDGGTCNEYRQDDHCADVAAECDGPQVCRIKPTKNRLVAPGVSGR